VPGHRCGKEKTKNMKFPSPLRTPVGAALLSALFPGLGQAAAGKPARGAIVAIPALTMLAGFAIVLLFDRSQLFGLALNQQWLTSLLILDLVALLYHLWAVVDSYLVAGKPPEDKYTRRRQRLPSTMKWGATLGIVLIVSGTFAVHYQVAAVDMEWQHTLYCLTAANPCPRPDLAGADGTPAIADPSQNAAVNAISAPPGSLSSASLPPINFGSLPPFPTTTESKDWAKDGQLNVLLLGVGVGSGNPCAKPNDDLACSLGPDTIMVLHTDLASKRASLISIGRNNYCVPLPPGIRENYMGNSVGCPAGTWPDMLNALPNEAGWGHCKRFPFYQDTCGQKRDPNAYLRAMKVMEVTLSYLLGAVANPTSSQMGQIDGTVTIDPAGLSTLIDDLGGIDINVPTRVLDEPCGPKGSWQYNATNYACGDAYDGYFVPTGPQGVARMSRRPVNRAA
jgi:hypothetical protein